MEVCRIIDRETGKADCPLESVEVKSIIGDDIAEVTVAQNFINSTGTNIEALYTFPLPHNAEVTGFSAAIGSAEVKGELMEKEEAFSLYDSAVRRGDSALLMESHRPDIFEISIGNLASGERVSVTISYLQEIEITDSELRWTLPTVIAPRYIPGEKNGKKTGDGTVHPTDRVPDADYITPPVGYAPYTLRIEAVLKGIANIKKISSPSHPLNVSIEKDRAVVTLSRENEPLDSDFVLTAALGDEPESMLITASLEDKGNFAYLKVVPDIDEMPYASGRHEYIFLIDVSGSMEGEKLIQAKRALSIAIRNLMDGDFFNIVAFESDYQCFSSISVQYSQENLDKADHWINSLEASGGTEIFKPLSYLLEGSVNIEGCDKIILLFTDGQVGNEREVINLIGRHNHNLSFFPFGIDTAVNKYFIDGLAEAGCGMPEYIYPGEHIEDKVIRQFARIHQPFIVSPSIRCGGLDMEVVPNLPKRLYGSETYNFLMKLENSKEIDTLTLCGVLDGKEYKKIINITGSGDGRLLSYKWAKGKIKSLEEMLNGGNARRDEAVKKEILEISLRYGVLSTLSSFVAVYKRAQKSSMLPETIIVPVSGPRYWQMNAPSPMGMAAPAISRYVSNMVADASYKESFYEVDSCMAPNFVTGNLSYGSSPKKDKNHFINFAPSPVKKSIKSEEKSITVPNIKENLYESMRKTAQVQRADGTFGKGTDVNRKISLFIIGMLLVNDYKPYRIQIMKAGNALMKSDNVDGLYKGAALYMMMEAGIYRGEDLKTLLNDIVNSLTPEEYDIYKGVCSRSMDRFLSFISLGGLCGKDNVEIASWLLKQVIE